MTEEDVVYFLKNGKSIKATIKSCRDYIAAALSESDELIRELSMPGVASGMSVVRGNGQNKIYNIYEKYMEILDERGRTVQQMIDVINEEEDTLNLVFNRTYRLPEPYRSVIIMLYINAEKWDTVCREMDISRKTLQTIRATAITSIAEGTFSLPAIRKTKDKSDVAKKEVAGQISITQYMEDIYGGDS